MYSEKPKNKRKNQATNKRLVVLLTIFFIVGFFGGTVLYISPSLFPARISLSGIESMTIQDHWVGLSPVAPVQADYLLTNVEGALIGGAVFSISYESITQQADINIPADVAAEFLKTLETVDLIRGDYHPLIEWTDDYPSITMTFQMDHGEVSIFTSSQGEYHVPWGATINDTTYVINSEIPMQAFNSLSPYLHRDQLDAMVDGFYSS